MSSFKSNFHIFAVGMLVGATAICYLSELPNLLYYILGTAGALFITYWMPRPVFFLALGLSLGSGWAFGQALIRLSWQLPSIIEGSPLMASGTIVRLPKLSGNHTNFVLEAHRLCEVDACYEVDAKFNLTWINPAFLVTPGDEVTLPVVVKRPWRLANPGTFDAQQWAFLNDIQGTGFVIGDRLKDMSLKARYVVSIDRLRFYLMQKLEPLVQSKTYGGVLLALTMGVKDTMDAADWDLLQKTGTSHLMAISGLHIGLLAGIFFFLTRYSLRSLPGLTRRIPDNLIASWMGFGAALIYAAIAGFSLPTLRALFMVGVGIYALTSRLRVDFWRTFNIALVGILFMDPFAPLMPGFWLSFGAVAIIGYMTIGRPYQKPWQVWLMPQLGLFLLMIPPTIYFFQSFSLISPIANLVAVSFMSFLVVPLALAGVLAIYPAPWLANHCWELANGLIGLLWKYLNFCASFDWSFSYFNQVPVLYCGLALAGSLWMLAPRGIPAKSMGMILWMPLYQWVPPTLAPGDFRLSVLDVGQGGSAVIQTASHTLLFDAGPPFGKFHDAGDRVILPYLHHQGIKTIDTMVISHGDNDHAGGYPRLSQYYPQAKVYSGEPQRLGANVQACVAGTRWEWDEITFEFLHPSTGDNFTKANDYSCVLKVSNAKDSILLTGDITRAVEAQLVESYQNKLRSTILLVPHHGSKSSSSDVFLNAVRPVMAFVSAGYMNRYGHPKDEVVDSYKERGIQLYNTAIQGMIDYSFRPSEDSESVSFYREETKRFWE